MTDERVFMFIAGLLRQDGLVPVNLREWFIQCLEDTDALQHEIWWNLCEFALTDLFEDIYNFVGQNGFSAWSLNGNMLTLEIIYAE